MRVFVHKHVDPCVCVWVSETESRSDTHTHTHTRIWVCRPKSHLFAFRLSIKKLSYFYHILLLCNNWYTVLNGHHVMHMYTYTWANCKSFHGPETQIADGSLTWQDQSNQSSITLDLTTKFSHTFVGWLMKVQCRQSVHCCMSRCTTQSSGSNDQTLKEQFTQKWKISQYLLPHAGEKLSFLVHKLFWSFEPLQH